MLNSLEDIEFLENNTPLGEGAISKVYKVRSKITGEIYALKKIDVKNLSKADCANLRNEIKLHQTFNHPSIIRFLDCLQIDNLVYILLEHAANGCLFPYINQANGLPESLSMRFLYQTALSVKYLHDNKIVHRDIKPENLLLDDCFNIKVCDFGWSCLIEDNQVRESVCGTYEYMPPEILNEETHTSKVDIWCLGILLYEMIHGKSPFQGNSIDEVKHQINNKSLIIRGDVSPFVTNLLGKLLSKSSQERIDINGLLILIESYDHFQDFLKPISVEHYELLLKNFYEYKYKANPNTQIQALPQINGSNTFTEVKIVQHDGSIKLISIPVPPTIIMIEEKINMISKFNADEFKYSQKSKNCRRNSETATEELRKLNKKSNDYCLTYSAKENFLLNTIIRNAIEGRFGFHPSGKIIVLERKLNWKREFYKIEKELDLVGSIFFVIYYDDLLEGFVVEVVPFFGEKNVVRKLLKKDFRGRSSKDLKVITNLDDFKLCHITGVFAVSGSLFSAILIADMSL